MMSDTIEPTDVEDAIDDYMEGNFDALIADDVDDHLEIGEILCRIREQLTDCAHNDKDMM